VSPLVFVVSTIYDGQGFMVPNALKMNCANTPNRLVRDGGLLYAHPIR
jgi:hypothetical protein